MAQTMSSNDYQAIQQQMQGLRDYYLNENGKLLNKKKKINLQALSMLVKSGVLENVMEEL